ncbi:MULTISPECIES: hypothetical protein [Cellulomonas]|uniref:Amino acid efflux transporter n=1 Tax=Cellulomonas iranensis TaxID=76862 RepID=A0ABU0GJ33_9CELL|nr:MULTISPECIES: hypothetical protein [Cellulomonas]MDQ0425384.1 amino acid efflux transporter [Cellulomonas iranensis]
MGARRAVGAPGAPPHESAPARTRASGDDVRTVARHVVGGVLGAGVLVVPPVVATLAGGADLLLWAGHVLLGGTVGVLLGVHAARTGRRPLPVSAVVGATWGEGARRCVDVTYAVAFAAGQAAIVWFAVVGVRAAVPVSSGPFPAVAPLALLAAAAAVAASPVRVPLALLRVRPWVAGALAAAWGAIGWPDPGAGGAFAPDGVTGAGALWLAGAALLFAGIGWEGVTRAGGPAGPPARDTARGVVVAAVAVGAVYLALAAVGRTRPLVGTGADLPAVHAAVAAASALVLASYVVTNLRTAASIAARVRAVPTAGRGPARGLVLAVAALSGVLVVLGDRDGAVPLLLLGPAAAATLAYALAAAAATRDGGRAARWAGGAVVVLLVTATACAAPALRAV